MSRIAQKIDYLVKFSALGEERFYRSILSDSVEKVIRLKDGNYKGVSPEIELLDASEKFLQLFRRERNPLHSELARLFRKAAHRIYRLLLKSKMIERSNRFLQVV